MIPLEEIRQARETLAGRVLRTPLVRLDDGIYLKLENLQPIGSFKLRGAPSAMRLFPASAWRGASTPRAPATWRQGVAWAAREMGILHRSSFPITPLPRSSPPSSGSEAGS